MTYIVLLNIITANEYDLYIVLLTIITANEYDLYCFIDYHNC
jgi:hypothetical protein